MQAVHQSLVPPAVHEMMVGYEKTVGHYQVTETYTPEESRRSHET
jgi:hypothetical protein